MPQTAIVLRLFYGSPVEWLLFSKPRVFLFILLSRSQRSEGSLQACRVSAVQRCRKNWVSLEEAQLLRSLLLWLQHIMLFPAFGFPTNYVRVACDQWRSIGAFPGASSSVCKSKDMQFVLETERVREYNMIGFHLASNHFFSLLISRIIHYKCIWKLNQGNVFQGVVIWSNLCQHCDEENLAI